MNFYFTYSWFETFHALNVPNAILFIPRQLQLTQEWPNIRVAYLQPAANNYWCIPRLAALVVAVIRWISRCTGGVENFLLCPDADEVFDETAAVGASVRPAALLSRSSWLGNETCFFSNQNKCNGKMYKLLRFTYFNTDYYTVHSQIS